MSLVPYRPKSSMKKSYNSKKSEKSMVALIKKTISRREETKNASLVAQTNIVKVGQIDQSATTGGYVSGNCMPVQIIGSGPTARVGNEIYPTSCRLRYTLYFNDNNLDIPDDIPVEVYVMAVSLKNVAGQASTFTLSNTDMNQLVNSGLGNSFWTGAPFNANLPLNHDYFTVHSRRRHKMCAYKTPASAGVGFVQPFNTSSYNCIINGSLKIKPPKKLIFNDSQTNTPVNFSYFLIVGRVPVNATGTQGDVSSLNIDWVSTLYYKEN